VYACQVDFIETSLELNSCKMAKPEKDYINFLKRKNVISNERTESPKICINGLKFTYLVELIEQGH